MLFSFFLKSLKDCVYKKNFKFKFKNTSLYLFNLKIKIKKFGIEKKKSYLIINL